MIAISEIAMGGLSAYWDKNETVIIAVSIRDAWTMWEGLTGMSREDATFQMLTLSSDHVVGYVLPKGVQITIPRNSLVKDGVETIYVEANVCEWIDVLGRGIMERVSL
jgi:hypothetical protein